jgi:hypothetical protein
MKYSSLATRPRLPSLWREKRYYLLYDERSVEAFPQVRSYEGSIYADPMVDIRHLEEMLEYTNI